MLDDISKVLEKSKAKKLPNGTWAVIEDSQDDNSIFSKLLIEATDAKSVRKECLNDRDKCSDKELEDLKEY